MWDCVNIFSGTSYGSGSMTQQAVFSSFWPLWMGINHFGHSQKESEAVPQEEGPARDGEGIKPSSRGWSCTQEMEKIPEL